MRHFDNPGSRWSDPQTTAQAVTLIAALVAVSSVLLVVIPKFEEIFTALGAELPLPTQLLLAASRWGRENVLIYLGICAVSGGWFFRVTEKLRTAQPAVYQGLFITVLGLTIGFIVVAMFLPVFQLSQLIHAAR